MSESNIIQQSPTGLPDRYRVTSPFGYRENPFKAGEIVYHNGVDLRTAWADQSINEIVRSVTSGEVVDVMPIGNASGVSPRVVVHSGPYLIYYIHVKPKLRVGQIVAPGDLIGMVDGLYGKTTARHLHLGIERGGSWIDPVPLFRVAGLREIDAHGKFV